MRPQSVLRSAVGWTIVSLGGLGMLVPVFTLRVRDYPVSGSQSVEYLQTASWLHAPAWVALGSVLVLVGFALLPPDDDGGTDEESLGS